MSNVGLERDDFYNPEDWPNGLRCMDCNQPFLYGATICKRLEAMTMEGDEPVAVVELLCSRCAVLA